MVTAHIALHSNTVTTSSCFGLSLPHLCNYIQVGSLYVSPSWTSIPNGLPVSRSQDLSAGGASRQRWHRQHLAGSSQEDWCICVGPLPQHSSSSTPNSSTKKSVPWQTASPAAHTPQLSVSRIQIFPSLMTGSWKGSSSAWAQESWLWTYCFPLA